MISEYQLLKWCKGKPCHHIVKVWSDLNKTLEFYGRNTINLAEFYFLYTTPLRAALFSQCLWLAFQKTELRLWQHTLLVRRDNIIGINNNNNNNNNNRVFCIAHLLDVLRHLHYITYSYWNDFLLILSVSVNSNVFSCPLYFTISSSVRRLSGREFQSRGPAWWW